MALMPPALRPACWALWAALRTGDDLIDSTDGDATERAARLSRWTDALEADLRRGTSDDPVRLAVVDTVLRWGLDPEGIFSSFDTVREDAAGRRLETWAEWSSWVRSTNMSWAEQCRTLLDRAGVAMPLRWEQIEGFSRFLDGMYLTDTLVDLPTDLERGDLLVPMAELARFDVAPDDVLGRRWTPELRALVGELTARARGWLDQPGLTAGLHPVPAILLRTTTGLFHARLRAVERSGAALLRRTPRVSAVAQWRVLAPARARAAVAWRLVPISAPPPAAGALTGASAEARPGSGRGGSDGHSGTDGHGGTAGRPGGARPVLPPKPHPSGARPPLIDADRMPGHVAVIADGNGRWATERGLPRHEGHRAGAAALRDIVHGALEIGLGHLTVYAFSTENWRRPAGEVSELFRTMCAELAEDELFDHDVRLCWAGRPDNLPTELVEVLEHRQRTTQDRSGLTFTLCVNYGGRAELADAAGELARAAVAGEIAPAQVSEHLFARHLPRPQLPDVDLLWRTGGDHRISNFLPWQSSYAELHFTDEYWPQVDRRDLWRAVTAYTARQRRLGAAPTTEPEPAEQH
ncbi:di-trans,poly-cis-decaprenylcistransferase [Streptomyces sp. OF8]|uniref:Isoprenyl transferase n=2 Tax=Streptomyces alkaliterrae TaxID=2213162 RepID=A0A5P0YQ61_9ACTN|nr:di-trans,poly-cis-decaprenylcistransferase [Streptomyces alkaliterrae]MQS02395.1 di-trans,poly-cis-decaprenylcistransferase [Streptomyces alkaliterrae]